MKTYSDGQRSLGKAIGAGVLGGLAGSWTMNAFQALMTEIRNQRNNVQESSEHVGSKQQDQASATEDPATVKVAQAVSKHVFGHELRDEEKGSAGNLAHYGMGAVSGAVYGAVAEEVPAATMGYGLLFGTVLWLVADEGIVPAVGLSKSPLEYPPSTHVSAWVSHVVYGITADAVRRITRRIF
jgi:putative membrane protein